jgi:NAD(P)-dependent dehydrogenase (short-subunit alcohol dehydrogenase family)
VSGRVALVSGSSAIGAAIAARLRARGDDLLPAAGSVRERGRLDLLVCAPAVAPGARVLDLRATEAADALEESLLAPLALVRELWPHLVGARGAVIVVSPAIGTYTAGGSPAATAAQHALTGWSRVLRTAGLREGVAVLTLHPGPPARVGSSRLARRLEADPGHVADVALRALERRRAEVWCPPAGRLLAAAHSLVPA